MGAQPPRKRRRVQSTQTEDLGKAVAEFLPSPGLSAFNELPISSQTKKGLKGAFFVKMTDIQRDSIPVALKGNDVLGAAPTGSGKTLAFLIPVLELLYRNKWGPQDGLGALIISPTRELAVQIFEVLRSIGKYHSFSAGLVIGGKNVQDEKLRLARMNILVATPGRLLQHMDQTFGFESDNLQVLVIDEADRILDLGFSKTLRALIGHLPKTRQTLLFSATQTQSVSDLATLSLKNPIPIGLGDTDLATQNDAPEQSKSTQQPATPASLTQHYVLTPLPSKLSTLYSFIKTHLSSKILVFLSACKQVRFVYNTFCKLQPGTPLLHLHGKQKQSLRLSVYTQFARSKHAVLFATDIAARGLDFPSVDWVVQVDAPDDADTYIHRVGRTARYQSGGNALLFLLPSEEEGMVKLLKEKKGIEVKKIKIKSNKVQNVQMRLQQMCFEDPELKYLGQKAFVSYLRSIHLQKDKSIFKLSELPIQEFAESLGLPGAPRIKFLKHAQANAGKNKQQTGSDALAVDGGGLLEQPQKAAPTTTKVRTKYDRMFERKNQDILSEHYSRLVDRESEADSDSGSDDDNEDSNGDNSKIPGPSSQGEQNPKTRSSHHQHNADPTDFFTLKRADHGLSSDEDSASASAAGEDEHKHKKHLKSAQKFTTLASLNLSNRKLKLTPAKRKLAIHAHHISSGLLPHAAGKEKIVFAEDGTPHHPYLLKSQEEYVEERGGREGVAEEGKRYVEGMGRKMREGDVVDREEARGKRKERKRRVKEREREKAGLHANQDAGPTVGGYDDADADDGYVSPEFDLPPVPVSAIHSKKKRKRAQASGDDELGVNVEATDLEAMARKLLRG